VKSINADPVTRSDIVLRVGVFYKRVPRDRDCISAHYWLNLEQNASILDSEAAQIKGSRHRPLGLSISCCSAHRGAAPAEQAA
jgi:hypothetical protein